MYPQSIVKQGGFVEFHGFIIFRVSRICNAAISFFEQADHFEMKDLRYRIGEKHQGKLY